MASRENSTLTTMGVNIEPAESFAATNVQNATSQVRIP